MTRVMNKTTFAAVLALTTSAGLALPAAASESATTHTHHYGRHAVIAQHHARIRHDAYRVGYNRGFRDGHLAAAEGAPIVTGRSAAVGGPLAYGGPFDNGGLLGTGLLEGDGVLGTGVLSGRGALGIGVLGF